jgi:hypothetical protein
LVTSSWVISVVGSVSMTDLEAGGLALAMREQKSDLEVSESA